MKRLLLLLVILLVGCTSQVGSPAYNFQIEDHDGQIKTLDDFQDVYIIAWSTT